MHPNAIRHSAGYVEGIPRLGIPEQFQTDAGLGVAVQQSGAAERVREGTSLPSGIATASTWNVDLARSGGAMIGSEARARGFNVMLAGGVNLMREPRNGRNFEYAGEDPLLAGKIVGAQIGGIQSNHIISTIKHFAINNQEFGRLVANARMDDTTARTSDLLAFQIAIEDARPGAVMCAYNKVNAVYSCENDYLLNQVLKKDWNYPGYVMSDWGGVHSTAAAINNGLDQESGWEFDSEKYLSADNLKKAIAKKEVAPERLDDMRLRILTSMFENGLFDHPLKPQVNTDFHANGLISQASAEEGMVLLKNNHDLLPINASVKRIAVIGGHADVGVLSGGGSSQVYSVGGNPVPDPSNRIWPATVFHASSPLKAIQKYAPHAQVSYASGKDVNEAALLAAQSDVAVVFATQWTGETEDALDLGLPEGQDALIEAVSASNRSTIVVLETGGPVTMPWHEKVSSILEAWYPGSNGGEAIARVLFGLVNPSGRLPATFPMSERQLPRPQMDGTALLKKHNLIGFDIDYDIEGAAVGYKWFDLKGHTPLYHFGHGLSYTQFAHSNLSGLIEQGDVKIRFTVANTGQRQGKNVSQVYLSPREKTWEAPKRLGGFKKVDLAAGETKEVSLAIDPRLFATYSSVDKTWRIKAGTYRVTIADHAGHDSSVFIELALPARKLNLQGKPIQ